MSLEKCFEADLEKNPSDKSTLLIYSDWLEENGQEQKALAIRGLVSNNCLQCTSSETNKLETWQIELLPLWKNYWISIGLKCGPANRKVTENCFDELYKNAGLESPKLKIWLDSPLAGCIASSLLKNMSEEIRKATNWDMLRRRSRYLIRDRFWDQVSRRVRSQVGDQVWRQVSEQVWDQVNQVRDNCEQVRNQIRDQDGYWAFDYVNDRASNQVNWVRDTCDQIGNQVRHQIRDWTWNQVGDLAFDQINGRVWDQVNHVRNSCNHLVKIRQILEEFQFHVEHSTCGYGQHDVSWLSFYSFMFVVVGIKDLEILKNLFELSHNCSWWWSFEKVVIITERPVEYRDMQLFYRDGFKANLQNGLEI